MEPVKRNVLDHRIHSFFVEQLRREFKEDLTLVADKLDQLIRDNTIKDVRFLVRQEIQKIKNGLQEISNKYNRHDTGSGP